MRIVFFLICLGWLPQTVWAQDPIFTQFYNAPESLSPTFTGMANTWNMGLVHRRQWPNDQRRIDTQFGFVNNLVTDHIGLGLTLLNHNEVFTNYNYIKANLAASYIVELDYDWRMRFGLEGGFGSKSFGFSGLLLEDQINSATEQIAGSTVDPWVLRNANRIQFFDLSAGLLFDTDDIWIGLSVKHLNRPDISFIENGNVPLDLFFSLHGGYFYEPRTTPSFFLPEGTTFQFLGNYMRQGQYNRLDLGTVIDYGSFSVGVMSAVNLERSAQSSHLLTSVNPIVTFNLGDFKLGYSFDINTSGLPRTGGVHELTLTWITGRNCSKCDNYKMRLKRNGEGGYQRM
ncbi:PorP/SprF family type IX secretion system membrane protein [Flavobacterium stagni]|uniref:Type IX secretion system membrane protein PorP/SprF n=1 Tax=Flavobacterium stagni TaxID=2506421 RepID=A0A4Q1K8I2_9FLAO|nr:PorP/SprF family type IX secretion system membrane protein [Flavobacterium stagni]RXR21633.1 type IX secretion system membrane protein PorP/SprF [Flavobacterium stagni]